MSTQNLDKHTYKHQDDVIYRKDDKHSLAILNIIDNSIFEVTDIAAEVFLALDGTQSLSEVKTLIDKKYKPPKELFNRDFEKLISDLKKNNLIVKI
jgi:hypothetical protein